ARGEDDAEGDDARLEGEAEDGEAEEVGVEGGEAAAEVPAEDDADDAAGGGEDEHELEVVQADLEVGVAEGLEGGDLLALGADDAAEDHVDEEGGDAEEDAGGDEGDGAELLELLGDELVGGLVFAAEGAAAAVAVE